jgi:formyl-CoA transferase
MALLDVQVAMLANMGSNYLASGNAPKRWGNAHPNIVPYQTFATSDGHIILAVGNDGQYAKFVEAGGRTELAQDERFATNPMRVRNRDVLVPILAEMVKTKSRDEWINLLEAAGVPCGPINNLDDVYVNPQVAARELRADLPHPCGAPVKLVKSPMKLSGTPVRCDMAPPTLGQHTEQVLEELLGHGEAEIAALRAKGIV